MVAPNGARRGRADHAALPLTAAELADDAEACARAGASAIHLHARDMTGNHTLDPDICRDWLAAVEQRVATRMVIQLTTEAVGRYTPAAQIRLVRALRPPAVSLAVREFVPGDAEPGAEVRDFLAWLVAERISPQYILYTPAEVARFHGWRARGLIPQRRPFVLFVLGRYLAAGEAVEPRALLDYLAEHDPDCPWSVCAFGREETACLMFAAALGGHIRVGFENSLWHGDGTVASCNAERVAAVVDGLRLMGRTVADPAAARRLVEQAAR